MADAARAGRVVQSPGVHQHMPIIVRHLLICGNERIYADLAVAPLGSHLVTGAVMTADVLRQCRRPRAPR
eukprot:9477042-Pyramimonas_sp.AAC.1